jgi:hypothetical protein
MGTVTPIRDRIEAKRTDNVVELRKQPRWIERMAERGLPNKDLTSWRPGPDAA